ncbi:RNA exonuclease 4-like [Manduca sexta]|uniref:RNA exonuclease 4-like n=1 Tax=Manduca sexta TaxID=7130 RepID=UPI00188EAEAA|nr:RNA exonuclease 4-like [Manduca sexta]
MSNDFVRNGIYLLLFVIDHILHCLYILLSTVVDIVKLILYCVLYTNMTEGTKKRKRNSAESHNQVVVNRGVIDANWQKFLSANIIMDKKEEKPPQKNHFTGTFRRARKKKPQNQEITSSEFINGDMKSLNLEPQPNGELKKINEPRKQNKITKFLAMDCEMVGIGYNGSDHMLARVSIVNKFGDCIYDKFVKAREEVKDYRTDVSGVRKEDLLNGEEFTVVQKEVSDLLKGKILVGHSLKNDLSVLFLSHPKRNIRDTARYKPFKKITKGSTPSLKRLAKEILGIDIQHGEHSSVEDARAAMQLYCTVGKNGKRV